MIPMRTPLTPEAGLAILASWLQDNIDSESELIFDNDDDRTDSAALLPCIEQVQTDLREFRRLQQLLTPAIQHLRRPE